MVLLRMLPPRSIMHQNSCLSSRHMFTSFLLPCSNRPWYKILQSLFLSRVYFQPIPSEHPNPSYVIHRYSQPPDLASWTPTI